MTTISKTLACATIVACAAVASGNALAQAAKDTHFIGPAVGISISALQNKVDYTSGVATIDGKDSSANDTDISLIGSWGFAMAPQWVGTLGLSFGTKTADAGSFTYALSGTQTITGKIKDHWSVSFAPGYRLGTSSLIYGKLAYHQISGVYTDTLTTGGTTSHRGTGIGLGYAMAVSKQVELRGEYEAVTYSGADVNLTTGKPTQKALNLLVLYKF